MCSCNPVFIFKFVLLARLSASKKDISPRIHSLTALMLMLLTYWFSLHGKDFIGVTEKSSRASIVLGTYLRFNKSNNTSISAVWGRKFSFPGACSGGGSTREPLGSSRCSSHCPLALTTPAVDTSGAGRCGVRTQVAAIG